MKLSKKDVTIRQKGIVEKHLRERTARFTAMNYEIRDIDYHEKRLAAVDNHEDPIVNEAIRFHMTAICCLRFGEAKKLDGPGFERILETGRRVPCRVSRTLRKVNTNKGPEFIPDFLDD